MENIIQNIGEVGITAGILFLLVLSMLMIKVGERLHWFPDSWTKSISQSQQNKK